MDSIQVRNTVSTLDTIFPAYLHMRIASVPHVDTGMEISETELDYHTDFSVLGRCARVPEDTGKKVQVSWFMIDLGNPIRVYMVHAAMVYYFEYTGKTHIMAIHNYFNLRSKMDFPRKEARFLADGYRSTYPEQRTYASIFSRDNVIISLTYASIYSLESILVGVQIVYLQALTYIQYWTELLPQ